MRSGRPPAVKPRRDGARILVVEDEGIVALDLRQRLTRLGYTVPMPLANGLEVLGEVSREPPNLVLMDIHLLGDMDGIETAQQLSEKHDIPVVFITAYSEESTLTRARATRPYGYLLKPFSERELHATIQMALERHQHDNLLMEARASLELALRAANLMTWEMPSPTTFDVLWRRPDEVGNGQSLLPLVVEEDRSALLATLQALRDDLEGGAHQVEFRLTPQPRERTRSCRLHGRSFPCEGRRRILGVIEDITQRKSDKEGLTQAAAVFENAGDALLILDAERRITHANPAFSRLTGFAADALLGGSAYFLDAKALGDTPYKVMWEQVETRGLWQGEIRADRRDGTHFQAWLTITRITQGEKSAPLHVVSLNDITALRGAEEQLAWLGYHDALTGLPNRALLADRLEQAVAAAPSAQLALLFIDLDHFKRINETLGHAAGDEVLRASARRLNACMGERGVVGRLGDDEFLVILPHADSVDMIRTAADDILAALSRPMPLQGREVSCGASIGVALYPLDGDSRGQLLAAADAALAAAKQAGRNRYAFYSPVLTHQAEHFVEKLHELRRALAQKELCLFYQPQLTFPDNAVAGVEALIRWNHPTRGLLGPGDLIPVAEEAGLINELGTWVLDEACRQLREWLDEGVPPLRMAVNVSALQMGDAEFLGHVLGALERHRIPPHLLEIEITESALQQGDHVRDLLHTVEQAGVNIAIDDFGTGFSCLASLKLLPIHRIKIDQSFVRNLRDNPDDLAITTTIITLAQHLKRKVIAEGVETIEQAIILHHLGCDEFQGYLFSAPQPAHAIPALLPALAQAPRFPDYALTMTDDEVDAYDEGGQQNLKA